ncbi:MAG: hypothetical protein AAF943_02515 [Pseudomonadota bacterium]
MSNTDSFIEEVNEEVRRDQMLGYLRRYGWIAVLLIVLIIGGAAFSEYRKAHARGLAESLGDATLKALALDDPAARAAALRELSAESPRGTAVLAMLNAAALMDAGDEAGAVQALNQIAVDGDLPEIYRQLAQFKALTVQGADAPLADRRQAFEALTQPGNPMRLLATEQLALIDIEIGEAAAAINRYQLILDDAEVSADLQQRALQVIVALGGEPDLSAAASLAAQAPLEVGN